MGLDQLVIIPDEECTLPNEGVTLERLSPKKVKVKITDTGAAGRILIADDNAYWDVNMGWLHEFLERDQIVLAYDIDDAMGIKSTNRHL